MEALYCKVTWLEVKIDEDKYIEVDEVVKEKINIWQY